MDVGQIGISLAMGAIGGALSGASSFGAAFIGATMSQISKSIPSIPLVKSENFNLSVSPLVGFGTSGFNVGASLNANGQFGDFAYAASIGAGYNSGMSSLGDAAGSSGYWNAGGFAGYNDGNANYGAGYSYTGFGGKTAQGVGAITGQAGDLTLRLDEDFFGDGKDRYRTGGVLATYRVNNDLTLAVGGSMMTGMGDRQRRLSYGNQNSYGDGRIAGTYDNCGEDLHNLRGGVMYGGVIYKGQSYFAGHNSEKRLHSIQNWVHQSVTKKSPYFEDRAFHSRFYSYYGSYQSSYLNY